MVVFVPPSTSNVYFLSGDPLPSLTYNDPYQEDGQMDKNRQTIAVTPPLIYVLQRGLNIGTGLIFPS
jgi:hypothetical protein